MARIHLKKGEQVGFLGSNLDPNVYYAMSLSTKLNSRELSLTNPNNKLINFTYINFSK